MERVKKYADHIAAGLLGLMFLLAIGSMWNDSAIRDEMPHIVAGYSYLTMHDYRINPEHPPLIKQLCATPLLFLDVNFPVYYKAWKDNVNDQWDLGDTFLYKSGNDADKMLFWGRIPVVILMILTGLVIYRWSGELFSSKIAGLISLILFALSPNIIAHGRFITTDMGITAFSVFALYSWWKFLKKPTWKTFGIASILQALMHLAKFSSPIFLPIIGIMSLVALFSAKPEWTFWKRLRIFVGGTVLATIIAFAIVGTWYQFTMYKMPLDVQQRLIAESISDDRFRNLGLATKLTAMSNTPILRPYAQYLLGFFMVAAHATYGHSTYFMGEVGQNWPEYYFIAYLLKEPIASQLFLLLSIIGAGVFTFLFFRNGEKKQYIARWFKSYGVIIPFLIIISIVMYMGMTAKLQLGIRYVIAIFPYLYIIIGGLIAFLWKKTQASQNKIWYNGFSLLVYLLAGWLLLANLLSYPHYLSYFNEYIGGGKNGWKYLIDSNLDWGQDLRRLKTYIDKNNITDIKVDYFGGGNLDYYLGSGNYSTWGFDRGPTTGWLAVSADAIQWNSANSGERMSYHWLTDNYEPVAKIGNSIFVYHIE